MEEDEDFNKVLKEFIKTLKNQIEELKSMGQVEELSVQTPEGYHVSLRSQSLTMDQLQDECMTAFAWLETQKRDPSKKSTWIN